MSCRLFESTQSALPLNCHLIGGIPRGLLLAVEFQVPVHKSRHSLPWARSAGISTRMACRRLENPQFREKPKRQARPIDLRHPHIGVPDRPTAISPAFAIAREVQARWLRGVSTCRGFFGDSWQRERFRVVADWPDGVFLPTWAGFDVSYRTWVSVDAGQPGGRE